MPPIKSVPDDMLDEMLRKLFEIERQLELDFRDGRTVAGYLVTGTLLPLYNNVTYCYPAFVVSSTRMPP